MDFRLPGTRRRHHVDATVMDVLVKPGEPVEGRPDTSSRSRRTRRRWPSRPRPPAPCRRSGQARRQGQVGRRSSPSSSGGKAAPRRSRHRPRRRRRARQRRSAPRQAHAPARPAHVGREAASSSSPNLGEGIENGDRRRGERQARRRGDGRPELFTIETDKASMPLPADADGKVEEVRVKRATRSTSAAILPLLSGRRRGRRSRKRRRPRPPVAQPQAAADPGPGGRAAPSGNGSPGVVNDKGVVPAGPATRRYAREHGVDLGEVKAPPAAAASRSTTSRASSADREAQRRRCRRRLGGSGADSFAIRRCPTSRSTARSRRSRSPTSARRSPRT